MRTIRGIPILLAAYLLFTFVPAVFAVSDAAADATATSISQKVSVYLKPDITIKVGEHTKSFYDANGEPVFPVIYQGSTYLPVRAISGLMGENIEWDAQSKTVFIGKTLGNPAKRAIIESSSVRDGNVLVENRPFVAIVEAYIKPDIVIMYDFMVQRFSDVNGEDVFPLNYQGSVYLPIRSISRLMGESIDWDAGLKLITISDSKAEQDEPPEQPNENKQAQRLQNAFDETFEIYLEATTKVANLQEAETLEQLMALADYVSDDCRRASAMTQAIKKMNHLEFNEEELAAYRKLIDFADASECYILILENITYLAATQQDYSIVIETFLNFAVDTQKKFGLAKEAIEAL